MSSLGLSSSVAITSTLSLSLFQCPVSFGAVQHGLYLILLSSLISKNLYLLGELLETDHLLCFVSSTHSSNRVILYHGQLQATLTQCETSRTCVLLASSVCTTEFIPSLVQAMTIFQLNFCDLLIDHFLCYVGPGFTKFNH